MYQVKIDEFEGPLKLLLELIEKEKLDITKLSLAKVADDYLDYISTNRNVDLINLSEFLFVASQLILLKSKALLPLFEFTEEEEEEIEDLELRLKEYQRYKKASEGILLMFLQNSVCFSKNEEQIESAIFTPPKISPKELRLLFEKVLQNIPSKEELEQNVIEDVVSLEEKIYELRGSLEKRMKIAFHEAIHQAKDKIDVIVTFLAMLEMIKQRIVSVKQENLFGEIIMEKR